MVRTFYRIEIFAIEKNIAQYVHFVKELILVVGNDEDEDGDGDVEGSHYDDYGGIMEGRDGSKHGHCPLGLRAT